MLTKLKIILNILGIKLKLFKVEKEIDLNISGILNNSLQSTNKITGN